MSGTPKAGYTWRRIPLTAPHVRKAASLIAKGHIPGRGLEWADTACPGLTLRLTRRAGTWFLRLRAKTVRIGTIPTMGLAAARTAALEVKQQLSAGCDPTFGLRVFQHAFAQTDQLDIAADAAWPEMVPQPTDEERLRDGPWQGGDLLDEFLKEKKKKLNPRYSSEYEHYLRHPAFDCVARLPVALLTIEHLEQVREDLVASCVPSAAQRSINQLKAAMTWGWKQKGRQTGLLRNQYPWWDRLEAEYRCKKRKHTPTVQELGRTLALAERYRTLGHTEHATGAGTLAMLWAVVLMTQRTFPLSRTRSNAVTAWDGPDHPGRWVVELEAGLMKSSKLHALPFPPEAKAVIDGILTGPNGAHGSSPWLFPSVRGDGPVSPNSVNQLLNRLGGVTYSGHSCPGRENLLARFGIRRWTPHDARRALATFLDDHRLGGSGSAILDHTINKKEREQDERETTAPVTRRHYDQAQRLALKAEGMRLWCHAILEAYETEKAALAALPAPEPRVRPERRPAQRPRHPFPSGGGLRPVGGRAKLAPHSSGWAKPSGLRAAAPAHRSPKARCLGCR